MMTTYGVMLTEVWPLSRFVPYSRNLRKNDHAIERMAASIQEFGFKIPVLARSSGEVVDGHLRLKAAYKLGINEIPVILCDEWSPAQVQAFRLLVNQSPNWAEFDLALVALEMEELKSLNFALELTGFDPVEIDDLLFRDQAVLAAEEVPQMPDRPVSQLGDLWLCGTDPHRVLCGDATSTEDVSRLLGSVKPDLMVTDPPYGVGYDPVWPGARRTGASTSNGTYSE